jgi:hypothetical protein
MFFLESRAPEFCTKLPAYIYNALIMGDSTISNICMHNVLADHPIMFILLPATHNVYTHNLPSPSRESTSSPAGFKCASKDASHHSADRSKDGKSDDSSDDADTSLDELRKELEPYPPPSSPADALTPAPAPKEVATITIIESAGFKVVSESNFEDSGYESDLGCVSDEDVVVCKKTPVVLQLQTCALPPVSANVSRHEYEQLLMLNYIASCDKVLFDLNVMASICSFSRDAAGSSWCLRKWVAM